MELKVIKTIYNSLRAMAYKHKLLLLHPNQQYSAILGSNLAQDESLQSVYYALKTTDENPVNFVQNLIGKLPYPEKKQKAAIASIDSSWNLEQLANHFAQVLAELTAEDYLLILDDFDIVDKSSIMQTFIEELLIPLPAQTHLMIRSRQMPHFAWLELLASNQASIFLDGNILEKNFHQNAVQGKVQIEALAFDGGRVTQGGKSVENWEGLLPRLLFFFILHRGQATRAEICEALWPGVPTEQAVNVFHVTKRRLHKTMGIDILVHDNDHYSIDPSISVRYDAIEFVEAVIQARHASGEEAQFWKQAIGLHERPFLKGTGTNAPWVLRSRSIFEAAYTEATEALS